MTPDEQQTENFRKCIGRIEELQRALDESRAREAVLREALEIREFQLGPNGVQCARCKAPREAHDPRTCEVAEVLTQTEPAAQEYAARVRREALEEAAECAENGFTTTFPKPTNITAQVIASAIRALAEKEKP